MLADWSQGLRTEDGRPRSYPWHMSAQMPLPHDNPLPSHDEVQASVKIVQDHADRIYTWSYERSRPQLVTLYNKAMASQWNSVTDLDWSTEVDPESLVDHSSPGMRL